MQHLLSLDSLEDSPHHRRLLQAIESFMHESWHR
jgi:hypothetical protein